MADRPVEDAAALLNGAVVSLTVLCQTVDIAAGEPVAYHPVADLLSVAAITTTARVA